MTTKHEWYENLGLLVEKTIEGGVVDVDTTKNRVVMNWSATDEIDHDGDLIASTAYNKTIKESGPKGSDLIYWLTDHWPDTDHVAGKVVELGMVGKYLQAVGTTINTVKGRDVLLMYEEGIIKQHSVGFIPVRTERAKDHRVIHEIKLYEGSSVLWGANSNTGTVSVGKTLMSADECAAEMDLLVKAIRHGKYSDESFGLLEIRLKQIQKNYEALLAAPPVEGTRQPAPSNDTQEKEKAEAIKSLKELKSSLSWN